MTIRHGDQEAIRPRVLVFSQRQIHRALFRCPHYELEDTIVEIDAAEILAPKTDGRFSVRFDIAKRLAWHLPIALNTGVQETVLKQEYELFFAVCGSPVDLLIINSLRNWKEKCRVSVCLLDELWISEMARYKHFIKMLSRFDLVMPYYSQGVSELSALTGKAVKFLPPGIDAELFCPHPEQPKRIVDVYSVGRRSNVTHQALLEMANRQDIFYLYDSVAGGAALDSNEHRRLFANIAKRSRYFLVNPALVDRPDVRGHQHEIGNRYFEGAAAGAVMIGERPKNDEFARLFDWPDAVSDLPYGSEKIASVIRDLDRAPERLNSVRQKNVEQSLMRHDWVYRWETVLSEVGLEPLPGIMKRKDRLKALAQSVVMDGDELPRTGAGASQHRPQRRQ